MSTPPGWTQPPRPAEQAAIAAGGVDLTNAARQVDLGETLSRQFQGANLALETLISTLQSAGDTLNAAFASTADYIKSGANETDKLAKSTREAATQAERGAKAHQSAARSAKQTTDEVDKTKFKLSDVIANLSRGNIGGAVGELFQHTGVTDAAGQGIERVGARYAAAGAIRGGITGRLLGGFGGGIGSLGTLLGSAGIGGVLAALYGGRRLFNAGTAQYRATNQLGQLTGEGFGAGLAARAETFRLGINPFDMLSGRDAAALVSGVRGAGFRGPEAGALEESIKGIVNDLGIGVKNAMDIAIPAIKLAGMSTSDLSAQMSTLDDSAKNARTSIGELSDVVKNLITGTAQFSRTAAGQVGKQIQDLEKQFQGTLAARSPAILGGFLQGPQREIIAQLSGFAPYEAYSTQFSKNFQTYFTRILVNLAAAKPRSMDWNAYVALMMMDTNWQQLFGQTPYDSIVDLLKTVWKGTDSGTNTKGYIQKIQRESVQAQGVIAKQGINDISSQFMKIEGHWGDWARGHGINPLDSDAFKKSVAGQFGSGPGAELNLVAAVDKQMRQLGISAKDRAAMEAPLREAVKSGTSYEIKDALKDIANRMEAAAKNVHVTTTVDIHPRAGKILRALNTPAIEAARGLRGKQGTTEIYPGAGGN